MKRTRLVLSLLALLLVALGPHAFVAAESGTPVEAEGFGLSKDEALLNAKRDAVEKGIGTLLISETEVRNYQLQKDIVLTRTMGAVKSYSVLAEERRGPKEHYVRIEAIVALAEIEADLAALKILLESMDKPRMLVVIQETGGKFAENEIIAFLRRKGFDLVDAAVVAALMQKGDTFIRQAVAGDAGAAAQIGADNGAEFVIVGNVAKSVQKNDLLNASGMVSGQASITAKVVNCSTAAVVAASSTAAAAVHVAADTAQNQATTRAAAKLMDRTLFERIVTAFQDMVNNGIKLDVTVNNVPDFKTQKALRERLDELDGVVSVTKKAFGGGRLTLAVMFKGNADGFSERVDGQRVDNRRLSVTDIVGNRIAMQLD